MGGGKNSRRGGGFLVGWKNKNSRGGGGENILGEEDLGETPMNFTVSSKIFGKKSMKLNVFFVEQTNFGLFNYLYLFFCFRESISSTPPNREPEEN